MQTRSRSTRPRPSCTAAFNTLGWENFAEPDHDGETADLFYCGADDGLGRGVVEGLIRDVGLGPVYVGGLDQADVLDGVLRLWFAVAIGQRSRSAHRVQDAPGPAPLAHQAMS